MTQNQISFANLQETKRHNLVTEGVSKGTLNESVRHNTSTEDISRTGNLIQDWMNRQTAAHYARQDALNLAHYERMDAETNRHNRESEDISFQDMRIRGNQYLIDYEKAQAQIETERSKQELNRQQVSESKQKERESKVYTEYLKDKPLLEIFGGASKGLSGPLNFLK